MKERPILFSGPMVRAIREDRKTQTRRIVNPQPPSDASEALLHERDQNRVDYFNEQTLCLGSIKCPYGKVGDRLRVKEEHYVYGHWEPVPGVRTKGGRQKWRFIRDHADILQPLYEPPVNFRKGRHHKDPATPAWHKRLARFMPREFSRTLLEITSIRVERLQDISDADAIAEGVKLDGTGHLPWTLFRALWESINGPGSWDLNPLVWVITFKRVEVKP